MKDLTLNERKAIAQTVRAALESELKDAINNQSLCDEIKKKLNSLNDLYLLNE